MKKYSKPTPHYRFIVKRLFLSSLLGAFLIVSHFSAKHFFLSSLILILKFDDIFACREYFLELKNEEGKKSIFHGI